MAETWCPGWSDITLPVVASLGYTTRYGGPSSPSPPKGPITPPWARAYLLPDNG